MAGCWLTRADRPFLTALAAERASATFTRLVLAGFLIVLLVLLMAPSGTLAARIFPYILHPLRSVRRHASHGLYTTGDEMRREGLCRILLLDVGNTDVVSSNVAVDRAHISVVRIVSGTIGDKDLAAMTEP